MLLKGRQGTELGLTIVEYQFPDELTDPWDSNALVVDVRVVSPHGTWEVWDPCLTTWEADRLWKWLAVVAARRPDHPSTVGYTEPNVVLRAWLSPADGERVQLRARLDLERRPPWLGLASGAEDLTVDLDVARGDLARASAALRTNLARFPQRGDDPTL